MLEAMMMRGGADKVPDINEVFKAVTYAGNSVSGREVSSGLDMTDGVCTWIRCRTVGTNGVLSSTLAPTNRIAYTDTYDDFDVNSDYVQGYGASGVIVGTHVKVNTTGRNYISWNFKLGAGFFDVVQYVGNGAIRSIAHNLGVKPCLILIKKGKNLTNWRAYVSVAGATHYMECNNNISARVGSGVFNNTEPTATHFTVGTETRVNESGFDIEAYLFADNPDLMTMKSYTGNGSVDGPIVDFGWSPQFVILKKTSASNSWYMMDTARGVGNYLIMEDNDSEDSENIINIIPNGVQLITANTRMNELGATYLMFAVRAPE